MVSQSIMTGPFLVIKMLLIFGWPCVADSTMIQ